MRAIRWPFEKTCYSAADYAYAENRLTGITDLGITYTYDAEGKRI